MSDETETETQPTTTPDDPARFASPSAASPPTPSDPPEPEPVPDGEPPNEARVWLDSFLVGARRHDLIDHERDDSLETDFLELAERITVRVKGRARTAAIHKLLESLDLVRGRVRR